MMVAEKQTKREAKSANESLVADDNGNRRRNWESERPNHTQLKAWSLRHLLRSTR